MSKSWTAGRPARNVEHTLHPDEESLMTRVRVESFSISLDGFGAGPDQSLDHPLGVGGQELHGWAYPTRTFQRNVFGGEDGTTGIDESFAARGFRDIGAWILGRNMFGPVRGPWPDLDPRTHADSARE